MIFDTFLPQRSAVQRVTVYVREAKLVTENELLSLFLPNLRKNHFFAAVFTIVQKASSGPTSFALYDVFRLSLINARAPRRRHTPTVTLGFVSGAVK